VLTPFYAPRCTDAARGYRRLLARGDLLCPQPALDRTEDVIDLLVQERPGRGDVVPLGQTTTAAGGRGVLGDEDRMAPHGSLAAVIGGLGRGQTLADEAATVFHDHRERLLLQIGSFSRAKAKAAAEPAPRQSRKQIVQVAHRSSHGGNRRSAPPDQCQGRQQGANPPKTAQIALRTNRSPAFLYPWNISEHATASHTRRQGRDNRTREVEVDTPDRRGYTGASSGLWGEFRLRAAIGSTPPVFSHRQPSYNEADSIAHPAAVVSEGLTKYFPDKQSVIINADNASPDGTEEVFLGTQTRVPKIYITTPENTPGKGWNFANAFRKSYSLGARAIVCVDADLVSITPQWMKYMVEPILEEGYDYLAPLYSRHKYDGTITNNICYPLVLGVFGRDIRQPIGGDFALSARLARHLVSVPWHRTTHQYGIDVFMTMHAILGDYRVGQVGLGSKIHKPSAPKLGEMFIQVLSTALATVAASFDKWKSVASIADTPVFGIKQPTPAQDLQVDRRMIRKSAVEGFKETRHALEEYFSPQVVERLKGTFAEDDGPQIDTDFWVDILFDAVAAFPGCNDPVRLVNSMRGLYFGRVFSFMNETWELSSAQCEEPIRQQGVRVFERRGELIERLEAACSPR